MSKEMVIWGVHPAHGKTPIKLEPYTRGAFNARQREGWTCCVRLKGNAPSSELVTIAKMEGRWKL